MSKIFRLSLVALLLSLMSVVAMAQSTTDGAIGGTVKDPNGAVVPNATVTVKSEDTNKESTATTDSEGRFRVVGLQPGNYTISINASGFGAFNQSKIVVEVGRVTSLDIPLSVGGVGGDQVEVTAEAPVINTTQQDFSTNINQVSINELPINGRRASDFVRLTPGVVPDGDFGLNSFRGISGLLNNSTVDGGDNNNAFFAEERGRTRISYVISQAAVREFQVNTSNYSAEYGRAAGGVVNTVTKSGSNEFHGSLFYYIRDNQLGARNPFGFRNVLVGGVPTLVALKPDDRRQQFGGTIGGPIVKDRLFFFFSYDQQRRNFPGIAGFNNPSFANLTEAANYSVIRPNISNSYPGETNAQLNARINGIRDGLISLTGEVPRRADQYLILPKIDWHINDSNTFTATYNRLRFESPQGVETPPVVQQGIGSFGDDFVDVDQFVPRLTSTITPTILNEFRMQYSRELLFQTQRALTPFENALAAIATVRTTSGNLPQVDVARTSVGIRFGNRDFLDRVAFPNEIRWQFADTMTVTRGQHTFKFGADINRVKDEINNLRLGQGAYAYSNINNFIADALDVINTPQRRYTSFQQAFGLAAYDFTTTDYNFFFQDDWRASTRLTVNLGMRYEFQEMPEPFAPNPLPNAPTLGIGPEQTRNLASDKNNFGPRLGLAYDITGDGKTSVRAGYGIYYGRIINSTISSALTGTDAAGATLNVFVTPTTPGAPIFPNVLAAAPATARDLVVFSPRIASPQIHQYDIILEREIAKNTVVSVSYIGSLGRRLPRFVDRNLSQPTSSRVFTIVGGPQNGQQFASPVFLGARPDVRYGRITEVQSSVNSEYNGLVLQANRRFTNGLQFQVNYTYSRATDTGQSSVTFTTGNNVLNPFDLDQEGGTSSLNIPHRFVASAVYTPTHYFGLGQTAVGRAIFGGWTISPIVSGSSGAPLTAFISGGISGTSQGGTGINGSNGAARPFFQPRNNYTLPRTIAVDLRLSRRFRFTETTNLEFLAEGFNIFNRTNFTGVANRLYSIGGTAAAQTLVYDPTFLTPSAAGNTVYRERQIQFALRFEF